MTLLIDLAELPPHAQRILDESTNPKARLAAAKGIVPGVKPGDLVAVIVALTGAAAADVAEVARSTLRALPPPILQGALAAELQAAAIDALARVLEGPTAPESVAALLRMRRVDISTVEWLAQHGSEAVVEVVAVNQERLLQHPRLMELLYLNEATRMSTADRIVEFAVRSGVELHGIPAWREVARAIEGELIAEPSDEPLPEDLDYQETVALAKKLAREADPEADCFEEEDDGTERLKDKFLPLHQRLAEMTVSQKIRRAAIGTREERTLLVRDQNRLVSAAAAMSPMLQEPDVALITRNRNVSEDVLRIIGSSGKWMKSYQVKRNLCENPRCPIAIASKLVVQLRESDLNHLAKDKNVPSPIRLAARRHLQRRDS